MTESSGTPVFPARDARLSPDAVAERTFTQVKRGYAESEVRAFLHMVSDELMALSTRERDLATRVADLEDRLSRPVPIPSDQDLIAALGEETARVLSQAREAAADLRSKADEHARRVVREAQESVRELRASTQQVVEARTREAEEAARTRAREIVTEARTVRERVLSDLTERRADLERQIGELRAGRGKLVEVYQTVERALVQATRTIAEEPPLPAAPPPVTAAPAAPPPAAAEPPPPAPPSAEPAVDEGDEEGDVAEPHGEARDVGALFEKLRTEAASDEPGPEADVAEARDDEPAIETVASDDESPSTFAMAATEEAAEEEGAPDTEAAPSPVAQVDLEGDEEPDANQAALAARADALAPVAEDLGRRAKRAVQDEQNDVLDGLRRQRGKIDPKKVLPSAEEHLGRWEHVLQPSVEAAYAAGGSTIPANQRSEGEKRAVPGELVTDLARAVVTPLRTRLESSLETIDARSPADAEIAIAQRLGARYREWRAQDLEDALADALAAAYVRGVYDAAPEGSHLRWIPARVGKCPDCDDNALEPTVRGDAFPTGQPYPPAHPGCRCLLLLVTA
jgi:DivIVA domain-containing protein